LLIAIQRTSLSAHTAFGCSLNGHFAPEAAIRKLDGIAMFAFHPGADIAHLRSQLDANRRKKI
jgi:hypothetical protein